ncbi:MAG: tripartite tricarboxylate transporter substrate binding protein [Firmicutes bacterium]|jgi:tripartite-type tricarboxylate transporter receptor subunit TctC|nr:tripartite tricarboxylate transporter substrate binding protein [Bacillota bacterium]
MKTRKYILLGLMVICLIGAGVVPVLAAWPTQNINLIVPWSPGGASDLTARTLAVQMEKALGRRITVTNTPGGSGAIGTQAMFDAPRDGYTWSGNADGSIITYQCLEYLPEISHRDYASFLAVFTPNVICVPASSPYDDFPAFLEAAKKGTITIASAGVGSSGHQAAEIFAAYGGVEYRHVPYQGGAPAVTATVRAEVDSVMQLSMEVTEMLRAKQLKALAVMDSEPLTIDGYGTIPAITEWIADFPVVGGRFGLFLPKDIPAEANDRITEAFIEATQSEAMINFAQERGSKAISMYGDEAAQVLEDGARLINWMLYRAGVVEKAPSEFGIPEP